MNIEDEVMIFHPDCGGMFRGEIKPGAVFHCDECGIFKEGSKVLAFAEGLVPKQKMDDLKRRVTTTNNKPPTP